MSLQEILQRLAEDRVIAERERRQHRIKEAFELARQAGVIGVAPKSVTIPATVTPLAPVRPLRELHEIAAPVLRVCARKFSDRPAGHRGAYIVSVPTESAAEIFQAAIEAVEQIPLQPKSERHEVGE
jgi:hypothetical protein